MTCKESFPDEALKCDSTRAFSLHNTIMCTFFASTSSYSHFHRLERENIDRNELQRDYNFIHAREGVINFLAQSIHTDVPMKIPSRRCRKFETMRKLPFEWKFSFHRSSRLKVERNALSSMKKVNDIEECSHSTPFTIERGCEITIKIHRSSSWLSAKWSTVAAEKSKINKRIVSLGFIISIVEKESKAKYAAQCHPAMWK